MTRHVKVTGYVRLTLADSDGLLCGRFGERHDQQNTRTVRREPNRLRKRRYAKRWISLVVVRENSRKILKRPGLVYLHSQNIIHLDVKAANIMINQDCEVSRKFRFDRSSTTTGKIGRFWCVRTTHERCKSSKWPSRKVIILSNFTNKWNVIFHQENRKIIFWNNSEKIKSFVHAARSHSEKWLQLKSWSLVTRHHPHRGEFDSLQPAIFMTRCRWQRGDHPITTFVLLNN